MFRQNDDARFGERGRNRRGAAGETGRLNAWSYGGGGPCAGALKASDDGQTLTALTAARSKDHTTTFGGHPGTKANFADAF